MGFSLCFLHLRNVKGHPRNHKRVYNHPGCDNYPLRHIVGRAVRWDGYGRARPRHEQDRPARAYVIIRDETEV